MEALPKPTLASPSVHRITFDPIDPLLANYTAASNPGPKAVDPWLPNVGIFFFKLL
jgi:hypothetical protein